eukprot:632541-Amphidinium_carterae.1
MLRKQRPWQAKPHPPGTIAHRDTIRCSSSLIDSCLVVLDLPVTLDAFSASFSCSRLQRDLLVASMNILCAVPYGASICFVLPDSSLVNRILEVRLSLLPLRSPPHNFAFPGMLATVPKMCVGCSTCLGMDEGDHMYYRKAPCSRLESLLVTVLLAVCIGAQGTIMRVTLSELVNSWITGRQFYESKNRHLSYFKFFGVWGVRGFTRLSDLPDHSSSASHLRPWRWPLHRY